MGIFNSGAAIGSVVAPPVIVGLTTYLGHWQPTFFVTGALGFIWLILWLLIYEKPERHKWLTDEEYRLIKSDDDAHEPVPPPEATIATDVRSVPEDTSIGWLKLLTYKQTWAIVLARFFVDPVWWLYITWLPLFLFQVHGFNLKEIGLFAWVPYAAADAGSLFGGWFSGFLIGRGWSVNKARKAVIAFSAALMPCGIVAAFTPDALLCLILIGLVLFGFQAWINNVQTLPSDYFPSRAVASVAGLGGTGAGIGSMIFIFATGWVVDHFSYTPILVTAGILGPLGTVVLFALGGKVVRLRSL
jgi:ACS family hexuronate transporter-like MFS transporter